MNLADETYCFQSHWSWIQISDYKILEIFELYLMHNAYLRSSSRKKSVKTWLFSSRSSWQERQMKSPCFVLHIFWKWEAPGTRDREAILRWAKHRTCDWPSQQELATFDFNVISHFYLLIANYLEGVPKQELATFIFILLFSIQHHSHHHQHKSHSHDLMITWPHGHQGKSWRGSRRWRCASTCSGFDAPEQLNIFGAMIIFVTATLLWMHWVRKPGMSVILAVLPSFSRTFWPGWRSK